jgi:ABC-type glycerol-3-phosphate transport system permease component
MVGMSMKTDDEAASTRILPAIPSFRARSPQVRKAVEPQQPEGVPKAQWDAILPKLLRQTHTSLENTPLPPGADSADSEDLRWKATKTLTSQLIEKMSDKALNSGERELLAAYSPLLTPDILAAAMENQLGRLEFTGLQVHTLDARIFNICQGSEVARQWKVESGPGKLPAGDSISYLQYHFESASDPPVVLRADFDAHISADQLHKLVISMQGDDSWHQIDATLDLGSSHWKTDLTTYIAQYRSSSLTLQPPGFDDKTFRPRTWVSLVPVQGDSATASPTSATLRLFIRPSSTAAAIFGKIGRNYLRAFRAIPFWTYIGNSILLVGLQMAGALLSSAFVAYAFARLNWPGRAVAFGILLGTMMVPSQVTLIPSFVIWRSLGWFNTLNPLWVPAWFGSGFFIFLMTQNMKTIPKELEEAARIDGLNPLQTWWYIILPLVKPCLAAIAIMVFMGAWNDFMGPLIMLRDQSRYPLSLGLFGMHVDQLADSTLIMAGNMLMTMPVVIIFFLFQRYFIEGVTVSGMKG